VPSFESAATYIAKAEEELNLAEDNQQAGAANYHVARAQVYATLAAACATYPGE
jgi:hypothetical protein